MSCPDLPDPHTYRSSRLGSAAAAFLLPPAGAEVCMGAENAAKGSDRKGSLHTQTDTQTVIDEPDADTW